jgi:hypothetical protein
MEKGWTFISLCAMKASYGDKKIIGGTEVFIEYCILNVCKNYIEYTGICGI